MTASKKKHFINKIKDKEIVSKSKSPNVLITSKRFKKNSTILKIAPKIGNLRGNLINKPTFMKYDKKEDQKLFLKKKNITQEVNSAKKQSTLFSREEEDSAYKAKPLLKSKLSSENPCQIPLIKIKQNENTKILSKKKISLQTKDMQKTNTGKKNLVLFGKKLKMISNKSISGSFQNTENSISFIPSKEHTNTDQKDSDNRRSKNSSIHQINKQFNVNSEKINNKILSNQRRNKNKSINFSKMNFSETSGKNTPSINLSQKIIYQSNLDKQKKKNTKHDRSKTNMSKEINSESFVNNRESDPNLSSNKLIPLLKKDSAKNYKITFDQFSSNKCFNSIVEEEKKERVYSSSSSSSSCTNNKSSSSANQSLPSKTNPKTINSHQSSDMKKISSRTLKTRSLSSNLNPKNASNKKNSFQNSSMNHLMIHSDINNIVDFSSNSFNNDIKGKQKGTNLSSKQKNYLQKLKRLQSPQFINAHSNKFQVYKICKFFKTDSFMTNKHSSYKVNNAKKEGKKKLWLSKKTPDHFIMNSSPFTRKLFIDTKSKNFSKFLSPKNISRGFKSQNDNKPVSKENVVIRLLSKNDQSLSFNYIPSIELQLKKSKSSSSIRSSHHNLNKNPKSESSSQTPNKPIPLDSFRKIPSSSPSKPQIEQKPQKNIFKLDKSSDSIHEQNMPLKPFFSSNFGQNNSITPEFVKTNDVLESFPNSSTPKPSYQILFKNAIPDNSKLTSLNEFSSINTHNKTNMISEFEIENNFQTDISAFNNKLDDVDDSQLDLNKSETFMHKKQGKFMYTKKFQKQKTKSNYEINLKSNMSQKGNTLPCKNKSFNFSNGLKKYLQKEKYKNRSDFPAKEVDNRLGNGEDVDGNVHDEQVHGKGNKNLELSRSYNSEYVDIEYNPNQMQNIAPNSQTINVYNENNFINNEPEEKHLQQSDLSITNQEAYEAPTAEERETTDKFMKLKEGIQITKELYDQIKLNDDNISSQTINSRKKIQKRILTKSPVPQNQKLSISLNSSKIKSKIFSPKKEQSNYRSNYPPNTNNDSKEYDYLNSVQNQKSFSQKLNIKKILNYQSSLKDENAKKKGSYYNVMTSSDGFKASKTFQNMIPEKNPQIHVNHVSNSKDKSFSTFNKKNNMIAIKKNSIDGKFLRDDLKSFTDNQNKIGLHDIIQMNIARVSSNNSSQNSFKNKYHIGHKSKKKNKNKTEVSKSLSSQNISFQNKLSKTIIPASKQQMKYKMITRKKIPPQIKNTSFYKNLHLNKNQKYKTSIQELIETNPFTAHKEHNVPLNSKSIKNKYISSNNLFKSKTPSKKLKNIDIKIPKYEFISPIFQNQSRRKFDSKLVSKEKNYISKKTGFKKSSKNFNSHNVSIKNNTLKDMDKTNQINAKEYKSINPPRMPVNESESSEVQNEIHLSNLKNTSNMNMNKKYFTSNSKKIIFDKNSKKKRIFNKNVSNTKFFEIDLINSSKNLIPNISKNCPMIPNSIEFEKGSNKLFGIEDTSNIYYEKFKRNGKRNMLSKTNLAFKEKKPHYDNDKIHSSHNYSNIYNFKNRSYLLNNHVQPSFSYSQSTKNQTNNQISLNGSISHESNFN